MGSIQGSMNQMTGAIGTALAVGKHIAKQAEANKVAEEAKKVAEESLSREKIKDEIASIEQGQKLDTEILQDKDRLEEVQKEIDPIEQQMEGMRSSISDKRLRTSKGQFMRKKADEELADQREALLQNRERVEQQLAMAQKKKDL